MKPTSLKRTAIVALLLTGLCSPVLAEPPEPALVVVPSPGEGNPRIQHLSWPKITRAQDGTLILAYSAGIGHNQGGSGLAVSRSKDDGETFTDPQLLCYFPDDDERYRDMGNLAMGVGEDGSVILLAMAFRPESANTIVGWRSTDQGETWQRTDTSTLDENQTGSVFGHVFPVPGKGMAVCGHYREPAGNGLWMAYSEDHGQSWGPPQTITEERYFEPTFIHAGGKLIGLIRENEAHAYHQFVSDDLGETWDFTEAAVQGNPAAVHPSPFVVADPEDPDTLYALVSERSPTNEIALWTCQAGTLQWERLRLLAEGSGDWTYPWMTYLGNDEWFLVYYQGSKSTSSITGKRISISE